MSRSFYIARALLSSLVAFAALCAATGGAADAITAHLAPASTQAQAHSLVTGHDSKANPTADPNPGTKPDDSADTQSDHKPDVNDKALGKASRASTQRATVTSGVNIRPCVDLNNSVCAPVGTTNGTSVSAVRCWRDGSTATGAYTSPRWFLLYLGDGREGYVHSSYVSSQPTVPNCSTLAYVRAADRALSFNGQVYAPSDVANRYTDWAPGPWAEWSGDCAKLFAAAYEMGAGVGVYHGNAIDMYRQYKAAHQTYSGLPRYGAPVFYDLGDRYGHVGIYIGGTTMIGTVGYDGDRKPVQRRDINAVRGYVGWAKIG